MRPDLIVFDEFDFWNKQEQAKLQAKYNLLVSLGGRVLGLLESLKSFRTSKQAKLPSLAYLKIFFRNFFVSSNEPILLVCLYLVVKRVNKPP